MCLAAKGDMSQCEINETVRCLDITHFAFLPTISYTENMSAFSILKRRACY